MKTETNISRIERFARAFRDHARIEGQVGYELAMRHYLDGDTLEDVVRSAKKIGKQAAPKLSRYRVRILHPSGSVMECKSS